ncbi:MAG TPA: hypothetical protein VFE33_10095 [Thermoanaerobaculia bacterium]|nr:hypothetical protein [Thermoanaerobaculia bacterium]
MQNRIRWATPLLLLLLGALAATAASADTVYLTNGKSFEGVIAVVGDSQVRVQMPGGEIRLPRSSVARVETADSSFSLYLRKKEALGHSARAADWLDLARWAKANGFEQGVREAALKAADLDPHQPGLGALLRPSGYVFDAQLDSFIPYAESMRRKGYVQSNGEWITREESAARTREREERAQLAAQTAVAEAQRQAAEIALYQAAQASQQPMASPYDGVPLVYGSGFLLSGGHGRSPHPHGHGGRPGGGPWRQPGSQLVTVGGGGMGYEQLIGRQPGSLFPVGSGTPGTSGHGKRH